MLSPFTRCAYAWITKTFFRLSLGVLFNAIVGMLCLRTCDGTKRDSLSLWKVSSTTRLAEC